MRRLLMVFTLVILGLALASCSVSLKRQAAEFVDQFQLANLTNEYANGSITYGLLLSDGNETYYQYKIDGSKYYINVMEERSFSQYSETESDLYDEAISISHMYCYNVENTKLYEFDPEQSTYSELTILVDTDIESVIIAIHQRLDKTEDLISFTDLYDIVDEIIKIGDEDIVTISFFGDFDVKEMTYTVRKDIILENAILFKNHLLSIYGTQKYQEVIQSIIDVVYDSINLKFEWDTTRNVLLPSLIISFRNVEYYVISVNEDDFAGYVDLPS
ncbi:MAG: hypothetical protein PHI01_03325 [Candidatus Izemoplasmatales bacterium]|nr:hypothetical protein [Candidatus Izemoplasmatales bacterium]